MKYVLTYGIACIEESNNKYELITRIPDLTTDKTKAEEIVAVLNQNQLSSKHFAEVMEDLIG